MKQRVFKDMSTTFSSAALLSTDMPTQLAKVIPIQTIRDYKDLFLGRRAGHLIKYMYYSEVDYYEKLVQEEKDYYLTRTETEILTKNANKIADILGRNCNIVEIGPGPKYTLETKVLPLLRSLHDVKSYTALDAKIEYAKQASEFIKHNLKKDINCFSYQVDCANPLQRYHNGKTCLLFLGSTLGNFTDTEINNILSSFARVLDYGEFIVLTLDCNKNLYDIEKAYNNFSTQQFVLSVMGYFKDIFEIRSFDPTKFKYSYEWDSKQGAVCANVISTEEQNFYFIDREIVVFKDKKYHVATSRKFKQVFVHSIFRKNNLKVIKQFTDDRNMMITYVVQKC